MSFAFLNRCNWTECWVHIQHKNGMTNTMVRDTINVIVLLLSFLFMFFEDFFSFLCVYVFVCVLQLQSLNLSPLENQLHSLNHGPNSTSSSNLKLILFKHFFTLKQQLSLSYFQFFIQRSFAPSRSPRLSCWIIF